MQKDAEDRGSNRNGGTGASAGHSNPIVVFLKKYDRYIGAIVLFVVLVLILAKCTGPGRGGSNSVDNTESTEITAENFVPDAEFKVDGVAGLHELIEQYFTAYAEDDLDTLETIAYPMSDNEKSYIGVFSDYIEEYQNIICYSKSGLTKGSYLVSVYYDLKFYNVETAAPGLEFFYVETDDDGSLYINNLYSSYNFSRTENELDPSINAIILKYEQQDDVAELLDEVNDAYTEAVSGDLDLAEMITTTIPAAMAQWLETISTPEETEEETETEEPSEAETTSETESESESESENESESEEEVKQTVRATTNVYIRSEPSTESEAYDKALEGETYTKIGDEGDWTIIEYNDGIAYIKSEYLEIVDDAD